MERNLYIHQIYFDDQSRKLVNPLSFPIYNKLLSVYFENDVLMNFIMTGYLLARPNGLRPNDLTGCLSYNYESKNSPLDFEALKHTDANFVVLPGCLVRHKVLDQAKVEHGLLFEMFFKTIVKAAGLYVDDFNMEIGIYQNGVLTTIDVWEEYTNDYLRPVYNYMKNTDVESIQKFLYLDSNYQGKLSKEKLIEISGHPYYTMHTFILERLWSLYYHQNKHRLMTNF